MEEIWKPIPGISLPYEASSAGRIRSLDRVLPCRSRSGRSFTRKMHGRILSPSQTRSGYKHVLIGQKHMLVHRLVANAFLENPSGMPCVNHIDGCKTNNAPDNLEWCDYAHNMNHAFSNGLNSASNCENSHKAKLNNVQVLQIRAMIQDGISQRKIAAVFGVHQKTVSAINTGRSWLALV